MLRKRPLLLVAVAALVLSGCRSIQDDKFAIYLLAQDIPAAKLSQLDINQMVLQNDPIISNDDIVSYDGGDHTIELTRRAYNRIQQIFSVPLRVNGLPFIVCVGKERIYAGAFWTPVSSLSYDGVVIMQPFDTTKTAIQISLGYPVSGVFTGNDPRADPRIFKSLEQNRKLK